MMIPAQSEARPDYTPKTTRCSKEEAEHYLQVLDEDAESFCFQTFDDDQARKEARATRNKGKPASEQERDPFAKTMHGTLDARWEELVALNNQGAGVFVTVNTITAHQRRIAGNVENIRAVFADFDPPSTKAPPVTWAIEPTMIVETSPGKIHAYWSVVGLPVDEFTPTQQAIVRIFGSDGAIIEPNRVMRVAGFYHRKDQANPNLVRIVHTSGAMPYLAQQIKAAFPAARHHNGNGKTSSKPTPDHDPIVRALAARDMLKARRVDAGWDIVCPWVEEHTQASAAGSTTYWPPHTNGYAGGGFKCLHAHCANRGIRDLREHVIPGAVDYRDIGREEQQYEYYDVPPQVVDDQQKKPFLWANEYVLTDEEADKIAAPEWAYPNMFIKGHVVAVISPPNGGKTTLAYFLAAAMAADGLRVFYVNADTSGGDAKAMKEYADDNGFTLLTPDLKGGGASMTDVVNKMKLEAKGSGDLSNVVWIFDTLKKMVDVINKSHAKELYKVFRALSGRGMCSVLLGHTNKHKGLDGKNVFEGTGDLRADVDELIYLESEKSADGKMIITTRPDKVRGAFEPITFEIDKDRNVSRHEYIDVAAEAKRKERYMKDYHVIEIIREVLTDTATKQKDVLAAAMGQGAGMRVLRRVLATYAKPDAYRQCWIAERGFSNNVVMYRKIRPETVFQDATSC